MTPEKIPICYNCKHFIDDVFKFKCSAFESIPEIIIMGENNHSKPLKGQKNDIVFEPIKKT
jgi:hypothetical protein